MDAVKKQRGGRSGAGFDVNPQNINENGRPDSGYTWKEIYIKEAQKKRDQLSRIEKVGESMFDQAEKGNVQAAKELRETMDGRAKQNSEDPGTEDNPMHMTVTIKKL